MVKAKESNRPALHQATMRCQIPNSSATPSIVSMAVSNTESAGISAFGTNQLRTATYWTKCFQSPQETFLAPFGPSAPNRSATDTRNVTPRANRRRIRATCKIRSFVMGCHQLLSLFVIGGNIARFGDLVAGDGNPSGGAS